MKILIIDDKKDNLVSLDAMLRAFLPGCETATAQSGPEGIEATLIFQPDTILLDIQMPGMDGFQVCQALKSSPATRHIPVIFLTAQKTDSASRIRGLEIGGDAFLTKPVEPGELMAQIRAMVRIKLAEDALRNEKNSLERVVAERTAALKAETANLDAIFDSSPVAMLVLDQNKNIIRANAAANVLADGSLAQLHSLHPGTAFQCVHSAQKSPGCGYAPNCPFCPFHKVLESVITSRAAVRGVEIDLGLIRNGSSQTVWLRVGASPILIDGQRQIILSLDDITEKKKIEAQFLRAQRMESVGTLASGVAHDLNNVLAPILISLPLLRHNLSPEELSETIDALESSVRRGAQIVKQLLTFGRGLGGERVVVQLKHLLKDMESIARETFPKNITLDFQTAPDLWLLECDPTQCHQALLNLCINARDAMEEGGILHVRTENRQLDESFASLNPDAKPGPYVCMQISDTGTGISPENMEKIFDPFFTTKEYGKGTGLGLPTVMGIVKSHEGFITAASVVGQGTTFEVFLPASPGAHAEEIETKPLVIPRGSGQTILVVDDEHSVRELTRKMLLDHGYNVLCAADGIEALKLFSKHEQNINLILTDYMMPNLDGLRLSSSLRQLDSKVKIILSSGMVDALDSSTKTEFRNLNVTRQITKPYSAEALLSAVHSQLQS